MTIDEFKKNIAPYMNKGWVAMDENEYWFWHGREPYLDISVWSCYKADAMINLSYIFNIEPVEDWTKSLIEVGQ